MIQDAQRQIALIDHCMEVEIPQGPQGFGAWPKEGLLAYQASGTVITRRLLPARRIAEAVKANAKTINFKVQGPTFTNRLTG